MASNFDELKKMIRSVLQSTKFGYTLNDFNEEYKSIVGENVPFREFGFNSIEDLIKNIPDTARFDLFKGSWLILPVTNQDTFHIAKNLSDQKCSKKKPKRVVNASKLQKQKLETNRKNVVNKSLAVPRFSGTRKRPKKVNKPLAKHPTPPCFNNNITASNHIQNDKVQAEHKPLTVKVENAKSTSRSKTVVQKKQTGHSQSDSNLSDIITVSDDQVVHRNELDQLAYEKKLPPPQFRVLSFYGEPNKRKLQYAASVLVDNKIYYSYPTVCYTPEQAEELCSLKALEQLKALIPFSQDLEADEDNLIKEIITILKEDEFHSLLENGLKDAYCKKHNKNLPANFTDIVKKYPNLIDLEVNKFVNKSIIRVSLPNLTAVNKVKAANEITKLSFTYQKILSAFENGAKFNLNDQLESQMLPPSLNISSNEPFWGIVKRIASPCEVIVRLLDYDNDYIDLIELMNIHYSYESKPVENLKIDRMYAAVFEETTLRVQVTQILNDTEAVCLFVDEGYIEPVDRKRICDIKSDFLQLPFQTFMVTLSDLELYEESQIATKYLSEYILKMEENLVAVELESTQYPFKVRFYDAYSSNPIDINKEVLKKLKNNAFNDIIFNPGVWLKGFVTEVTLTGDVYLHFESKFLNELELRQSKLNQLCMNQPKLTIDDINQLSCDNVYYVHYFNSWYRSKVNKIEKNIANIFFLDFGTTCNIKLDFLRSFKPDEDPLYDLPYLAIKCHLENVPSDPSLIWSSRATYKLLNMLAEYDLVSIEVSRAPCNSKPCQIQLCHKVNDEFILINMKLDAERRCFDKNPNYRELIDTRSLIKFLEPQIRT